MLEFKKKLEDFNEQRRKQGLPPLEVGIGICTGEAATGILGRSFKEVSVIGSTTNTAARLQGISRIKDHRVIVNQRAYECLREKYDFECYEDTPVKGLGLMTLYGYPGERVGE